MGGREGKYRTLEQPDPEFIGHPLRILVNRHIKAEDTGKFLRLLKYRRTTHYILLVHRTDVNARNRNLADIEEIQQRFEGTKRARLHTYSPTRLVDRVKKGREIAHDFILEVVFVVIWADY